MSWGMVMCSTCKREVHQARRPSDGVLYWYHCDDKSDICPHSQADYVRSTTEVKGKWCGFDGLPGKGMPPAPPAQEAQKEKENDSIRSL